MAFIQGSRGIYKPIRVLFETPVYEETLEACWFVGSYKTQIALMVELTRLQQDHQIPAEVSEEDMCDLLVEETKTTARVQLWEWRVGSFDEDVQPLIKLVWLVNTSMKMRDVQGEARRLLVSPEDIPPLFQHQMILSEASEYARKLREKQQQPDQSKLLGPREVIVEVVPKVLQGIWVLPQNISLNMPSKALSKMAVGVTKAVEDQISATLSSNLLQTTFSRSTRDIMVLSILEAVENSFVADTLGKMVLNFDAELLSTITEVAVEKICELFQCQPHSQVPVADNTHSCKEDAELKMLTPMTKKA